MLVSNPLPSPNLERLEGISIALALLHLLAGRTHVERGQAPSLCSRYAVHCSASRSNAKIRSTVWIPNASSLGFSLWRQKLCVGDTAVA